MKTIKSVISKPSQALRAMCVGLMRQSKRPDFVVDMDTYGLIKNGICYGCAATSAVQEIAKKDLTANNYGNQAIYGDLVPYARARARSCVLELDYEDLRKFESIINMVRRGETIDLFQYFGVEHPPLNASFRLTTTTWKRELPKVYAYIKKLEALGL